MMAGLLRCNVGKFTIAQNCEQSAKVDAAHEKADDRVYQVSNKAAHDGCESRTDDDTNSHVHDIAFGDPSRSRNAGPQQTPT